MLFKKSLSKKIDELMKTPIEEYAKMHYTWEGHNKIILLKTKLQMMEYFMKPEMVKKK